MRLLFRQIRSVRRHPDQGPKHGPEGIELAPLEDRVDRLDPIHELLARVLGHRVSIADPELSLCGSRGILMMGNLHTESRLGLRLRSGSSWLLAGRGIWSEWSSANMLTSAL